MTLFKYLDEKGTLATIENCSVLLKTPSEYNDPFDSVFYVDSKEMDKAFDLYVNFELFKKLYKDLIVDGKKPSLPGKIVKAMIIQDLPKIKKKRIYKECKYLTENYKLGLLTLKQSDKELRQRFHVVMSGIMDSIRSIALVSCFALKSDSIPMWSHYANMHKGACIEFEIDGERDFKNVAYYNELQKFEFTHALEVIFGHQIAKKDIDTENSDYKFILDPIFNKAQCWEYEKEIRCVFPKKNSDPRIYEIVDKDGKKWTLLKMPKIKNIYLGCNADNDFVNKVKDIANNIPIIKMRKKAGEYGVVADKQIKI